MSVRGGGVSRGESDLAVMAFVVVAGIVAIAVLFARRGPGYAEMMPGYGANQIRPAQARMVPGQTLMAPMPAKEFGDFGVLPVPSSPLLAASDLAGVGRGSSGLGSLDEAFPDPLRKR